MTDPTPTRAEDARIPDHCAWEMRGHWSKAYEALLEDYKALRERAEAAERTIANLHAVEKHTRDKANALFHMNGKLCADYDEACAERDAARRAEAAAWNDAIEAAAEKCDVASMDHIGDIVRGIGDEIRALRRAAPTEGEA